MTKSRAREIIEASAAWETYLQAPRNAAPRTSRIYGRRRQPPLVERPSMAQREAAVLIFCDAIGADAE